MAEIKMQIEEDGNGDYTSLEACLNANEQDLVAGGDYFLAEICGTDLAGNGWDNDDTTAVSIDGWTTGTNNYISVYTTVSARHSGKWGTGSNEYRLHGAAHAPNMMAINEEFVEIAGLQMMADCNYASGSYLIELSPAQSTACVIYLHDLILKEVSGESHSQGAINARSVSGVSQMVLSIWNCVIYDFDKVGAEGVGDANEPCTINVYNCTFHNCDRGIDRAGATINAYNCGTASCANANDSSSETTCSTTTPTFVDENADDFHLASNDVTWHNQGTDNPSSGLYFDDIDGDTRVSIWDIGADEYVAPSIGAIMNQFQGANLGADLFNGSLI